MCLRSLQVNFLHLQWFEVTSSSSDGNRAERASSFIQSKRMQSHCACNEFVEVGRPRENFNCQLSYLCAKLQKAQTSLNYGWSGTWVTRLETVTEVTACRITINRMRVSSTAHNRMIQVQLKQLARNHQRKLDRSLIFLDLRSKMRKFHATYSNEVHIHRRNTFRCLSQVAYAIRLLLALLRPYWICLTFFSFCPLCSYPLREYGILPARHEPHAHSKCTPTRQYGSRF